MGVPALFLDQFLSTHASSVQAMLSSANGPLVTAQILLMLPLLRVIVTTSAGLDHVDLLANAGKVFSEDVADMAVVMFSERFRLPIDFQLGGKRVGTVGLGSIGLEVAKRLEAFWLQHLTQLQEGKTECLVSFPFQHS
ncbi:glyoxylate/hydroxypyruvate reductase HPR3-like [Ziziphus jujuba]|uniref:Glyoxylate/hydroxypyruvate reductase HPR3-like n=1 Tax=Ziziphus jujuba TaxID=326968 RepID=A0ABM3ZVW7_ZIZJJ|nr:glyoxylate/hydroxypyruvate reductase HPR3-like [Ziziphus jujuba]